MRTWAMISFLVRLGSDLTIPGKYHKHSHYFLYSTYSPSQTALLSGLFILSKDRGPYKSQFFHLRGIVIRPYSAVLKGYCWFRVQEWPLVVPESYMQCWEKNQGQQDVIPVPSFRPLILPFYKRDRHTPYQSSTLTHLSKLLGSALDPSHWPL